MRIGGIASGMDTEQMIKELIKVERGRVDKLFRQEETLKWKRDALNTTNKTLADFILKTRSSFGLTSKTSSGTIINNSIKSFEWVKKVSSSNESIATATASASAMEGTHTIKVEELAEVANVTSENLTSILNNNLRFSKEGSFTIATANGQVDITIGNAKVEGSISPSLNFSGEGNSVTVRINGKEVVLDKDFTDIGELGQHIQDQIGPEITVDTTGGKLSFTSIDPIVIDSADVENLENKLGFKSGIYKASNSISDVVNKINNAKNADGKSLGLRAAYDSNLGKLMIATKDQGKDQFITIGGDLADDIFGSATLSVEGKNALINFNGDTVEQKSNNFSMFGVNYQLKSKGEFTVNVDTNVDGIMDKVKGFVEDYNALIDNLNGLLKEKTYRDFKPLTTEEKQAMKDKEIELWEEKARSGLLRSDETITRIVQTMREGLYKEVDGLDGFKRLIDIGITTGNYQSGGKLEINEDKLRKAINEDADGVVQLLFKTSDIRVPSENTAEARELAAKKRGETGLVERLFGDMVIGMKDIVRRSGTGEDASLFRSVQSNMLIDFVTSGSISIMDKNITDIGKRMIREERILAGREERYWRQFAAMEKALQSMNSQSSWLASQLGQMG